MSTPPPSDAFSRLAVGVFRLNGALIAVGDRLVADLKLTSARWQVLGAAAVAPVPLTVASIARNMGLTRQTVRTTVGELEAAGFVRLADNPHHRTARLVLLTPHGERAYAGAMERQQEWSRQISHGLDGDRLGEAVETLQAVLARLGEAAEVVAALRGETDFEALERRSEDQS